MDEESLSKTSEIFNKIVSKKRSELEELRNDSKNLSELLVIENFLVEGVLAKNQVAYITPRSERIVGSSFEGHLGGYISDYILKVRADNSNIPTKTLSFRGNSIVTADMYIAALIPKFEKKKIDTSDFLSLEGQKEIFYFNRDFKEEEIAIKFGIFSPNGKIIREEEAVNYNYFLKN